MESPRSPVEPIVGRQRRDEWSRGYYCAVAELLRETGYADTAVRSLFASGGSPDAADSDDIVLFAQHGLMPLNAALSSGGTTEQQEQPAVSPPSA